ncbi:hypothetical protein ACHAWF_007585, partial [Thalassiosira exigua]
LGNVTKIGSGAFDHCTSLDHLPLPSTVIDIGLGAFRHCKALVEVDLSHLELLKIRPSTFTGCNLLKGLTLPSTLVAIEDHAFFSCGALRRVELPNGLQKVGDDAFSFCGELEILTIPSTLVAIGKRAFGGCLSLRTVEFGQGVHHVGEGAFDECLSLDGIKIPQNAFVIEWGDDTSCVMVEDTTFPLEDEDVERTVVSGNLGQSEHLLAEVEEKINIILGRHCTIEEKLGQIRSMIFHVKMVDATTCLELALLKANMEKEQNLTAAPITRKRRRETRESSRVICGAEIVIPNVLSFLDGN